MVVRIQVSAVPLVSALLQRRLARGAVIHRVGLDAVRAAVPEEPAAEAVPEEVAVLTDALDFADREIDAEQRLTRLLDPRRRLAAVDVGDGAGHAHQVAHPQVGRRHERRDRQG